MPSKATKKRRQEKLKQAEQQRSLQPRSVVGSQQQSSEYGASASFEPVPSSSTTSLQEVGESFGTLKISEKQSKAMRLVPKPPPSQIGTPIELISNHFQLNIPDITIYHYDVTIDKVSVWTESQSSASTSAEVREEDIETLKERGKAKIGKYRCYNTKTNRRVLEKVFQSGVLRRTIYVYDGKKNMFTIRKIPNLTPIDIDFEDDLERQCKFEITIQPVEKSNSRDNSVSLEPLRELLLGHSFYLPEEAILVLETIMRHQPAMYHMPVGRTFFRTSDIRENDLPGGRLVRKGYHQSMLVTEAGVVLNIDVAATTFYQPGSVINFLREMLQMVSKEEKRNIDMEKLHELPDKERRRLNIELNGCRIYATHFNPHRKYKVHGVSEKSADNLQFEIEKRTVSVTQYFRETYKRRLKYGRFPCLKVHKSKDIYLPLEVCEIPEGEHCLGKPGKLQTSEMIKCTALPPAERFQEIRRNVNQNIRDFGEKYSQFGITVNPEPVSVTGRLVDPPVLLYKSTTRKPFEGKWNLVNNQLRIGAVINKWAILATTDIRQNLDMFHKKLLDTASKFGLPMAPAHTKIWPQNRFEMENITTLLKNICEMVDNIQLVVVVLKSKNDKDYCKIKCVAETELGVITQCLVKDNIIPQKCNEQFLANLCLKINGKLGGKNSILHPPTVKDFIEESIMVIGADCNHPGPHDEVNHSVAATVCSLDPEMVQFASAFTIQPREKNKRIELMKKLKPMVIELLGHYYSSRKKYPKKIIFLRDGVSEGEYVKALNEEVPQVLNACRELIRGECPKLTFLVVNKRHHTRLMVKDSKDGVKPQGNIPPGTKVDTGITHILNFDFYLCSQNGIKGTSRPSHYTVLYDDNNFGSRENKPKLERLCYSLCHLSSRCTRSISIPAPVDYAHHLAYRVKQYLIANASNEELLNQWINEIGVASQISNSMFFI